jgi:hypothetical protein
VSPIPAFEPSAAVLATVFWDRQGNGDTLFAYRRR